MEILYSARAARDILAHDLGWRNHHAGRPDLFRAELDKLLALLSTQPRMGRRTNRYKEARVLVVRETEHLLFYRVHRRHISVLAVLPGRAQRVPVSRM